MNIRLIFRLFKEVLLYIVLIIIDHLMLSIEQTSTNPISKTQQ